MAFTPYDQLAMAQYTPLTAQEILMPAAYMREQHDKMDEQYAAIGDELGKVAVMTANDPELSGVYKNYENQLLAAQEQLATTGINSNTRRAALGLRKAFSEQIAPINIA
jgi:hypothetical protein